MADGENLKRSCDAEEVKEEKRMKKDPDVLEICNRAIDHKCMVTFHVGTTQKESIKVHSCLLASKSPAFEKMFFGSLKEIEEVNIIDADPETFKAFVRFLYYQSADLVTESNTEGLLYLATKYLVNDLPEIIEKFLTKKVDINNLASRLNTSVCFCLHTLQGKCIDFILRHQKELFPSNFLNDCNDRTVDFLLKSPYLAVEESKLLQTLLTWTDVELARKNLPLNSSSKQVIFTPLLRNLRLNLLSVKEGGLLLRYDFCPEEAKEDIMSYFMRKEAYFVPTFFSSMNPRMAPWQAMGLTTTFFKESSAVKVSKAAKSCWKFAIFGVFIRVKCDKFGLLADKLTWSETECEEYEDMFTVIPKCTPGLYYCCISDGLSVSTTSWINILGTKDTFIYDTIHREVNTSSFIKITENVEDFMFSTFQEKALKCSIVPQNSRFSNSIIVGVSYRSLSMYTRLRTTAWV